MCVCVYVWVGGRVSALVGLPFLILLLSSVAYMCASTYCEGATTITTTTVTYQELMGVSVTAA